MPVPNERNIHSQVIGRLYSGWMRSGQTVPECFDGTLLEYASFYYWNFLAEHEIDNGVFTSLANPSHETH